MAAPLSTRSYVLVTPDKIKFNWDRPIYCKVKKLNARSVEIEGLHDAIGHSWTASKTALTACTVSAQEARSNTQGPLLRQPVIVQHQQAFHYGQVISSSEDEATVQLKHETITASAEFVSPVAPVVALLMYELAFPTTDWTLDELLEMNEKIVDGICGSGSSTGSRDISVIMGNFVEESSFPESNVERTWIDPATGKKSKFPLQHAIDYAHFVDGHADEIPPSIGKSFCCPPRRRTPPQRAQQSGELTLFNHLVDDDDNSVQEPTFNPVDATAAHRSNVTAQKRPADHQSGPEYSRRQRTAQQASGVPQADAQIAQLLLNHPGLTERFLQLQATAAIATNSSTADPMPPSWTAPMPAQPNRATDYASQYASAPPTDATSRSKYAFSPSANQRRIHALAISPRHLSQGKSPSVFIESLITSSAVTFKPSPSVLVRIFDISFGTRGLSIMHLAPLKTMNEKAIWILTGGVNMQNFSAAIPLPPAAQPQSLDDVLDALLALETFSNEYFSDGLQGLVSSLVKFTKQQLRGIVWQSVDLILVVFWINSLLEKFRVELETGASDGSDIKLHCSLDNPDLRQIVVQIQQRQIQQLQSAIAQAAHSRSKTVASPRSKSPAMPHDGSNRKGVRTVKAEYAIPPDVYALLPVRNDKRLCLRFISNAGCRSTSNTKCTATSRAHFVPDRLDKLVRDFVDEKFGGVKSEYARL